MRIISGKYKGRTLKIPKGIRPTQDKVRKALFDILADVKDLSFLDLFAGSGAVGIEALSLGAKEVVFVEQDRRCIEKIKENIPVFRSCGLAVIRSDIFTVIKQLHKQGKKFDIIFLDPPYAKSLVPRPYGKLNKGGSGLAERGHNASLAKKTLQMLSRYDILASNGFLVVQHFKKDSLPESIENLALWRQAKYGDTLLSFYKKVTPAKRGKDVSKSSLSG